MVAKLIVVNGPPGIGKSTIAERYATTHPLTLWLDTDQIRGLIGGWEQAPERAGRAARSLVVRMAHEHLSAGMDVIVSQLYTNLEDLQRLEDTARQTQAGFIEVVLMDNRSRAAQRFLERGGPKTEVFDEEDPSTGFTDDLLVLYLPENTPIGFGKGAFPTPDGGHPWNTGGDVRWQGHGILQLHRPDDAYSIWVFWQGPKRAFRCWYLNLQAPMQITPTGIDTLDHALDIVLAPSGEWSFKDVEKMEGWVELGRFTPEEAEGIQHLASELGQMIDDGQTWWSEDWKSWTPADHMTPVDLPPGWDELTPL